MKPLLFFLFFCGFANSQYTISTAERNALVSLYQSTGGNLWSQSWDLNKDPEYWYGIKITNHEVVEINLRGNSLEGSLPNVFSVFTNLQVLDLSNNNLSGQIPFTVGNLAQLNVLSICDNNLTGDPSIILSPLNLLTELSIGHNKFTFENTDNFLQNFPQLQVLDIANLNLTTVPGKISILKKLEILDLSDNQLQTNFSALSTLTELKVLSLAGNQLETIPSALGNISQLTTLDLSRNLLATNFNTLSSMGNLEWLSLESNRIQNLPSNIGILKNLIHLNLGRNLFSGNFSALGTLTKLQQLYLNNNKLKGAFPTELLLLPQLQMLSLSSNLLSGNLPIKLPSLTFLEGNYYSVTDIKTHLDKKPKYTDFTFSPQRYDEPLSINGTIGEYITLKQSLCGAEYSYTWFKNLDIKQPGTMEQYNINGLKKEDFTEYTCEAYFAKNYPDYLLEISFFREPVTVSSTLNTAEDAKNLSIYPNPTSDILFVRAENEKVEQISIYDMTGKLVVADSGPSRLRQNVRAFPSGTYLITIKTATGIKTFKFIKL